MKIHTEFEQKSVDWMIARAGKITASEFNQIFTPTMEPRKGQMPETYLMKKLSEYWLGGPLPGFNSIDMDQGNILEEEAIPWFSFETGNEIKRVGFITTDDEQVGCSPDGMLNDGTGIEIKCPSVHVHLGYVLDGGLPDEYAPQVHGTMYVTGAPSWRFMSYHRRTPTLLLVIERDEKIQARIADALGKFLERFEEAKAKLINLNGGPPKRSTPKPTVPEQPKDPEYIDLIP